MSKVKSRKRRSVRRESVAARSATVRAAAVEGVQLEGGGEVHWLPALALAAVDEIVGVAEFSCVGEGDFRARVGWLSLEQVGWAESLVGRFGIDELVGMSVEDFDSVFASEVVASGGNFDRVVVVGVYERVRLILRSAALAVA